jgi:hypothetical protein
VSIRCVATGWIGWQIHLTLLGLSIKKRNPPPNSSYYFHTKVLVLSFEKLLASMYCKCIVPTCSFIWLIFFKTIFLNLPWTKLTGDLRPVNRRWSVIGVKIFDMVFQSNFFQLFSETFSSLLLLGVPNSASQVHLLYIEVSFLTEKVLVECRNNSGSDFSRCNLVRQSLFLMFVPFWSRSEAFQWKDGGHHRLFSCCEHPTVSCSISCWHKFDDNTTNRVPLIMRLWVPHKLMNIPIFISYFKSMLFQNMIHVVIVTIDLCIKVSHQD